VLKVGRISISTTFTSVAVIILVVAILGCELPGVSEKKLDIRKTNVRQVTSGSPPNLKLTIIADIKNHGSSGSVTVRGYVEQDGKVRDEAEKRIHLLKGDQQTVSFELDIDEGDYSAKWDFLEQTPD
jgi:hypothetical protein